MLNPHRRIWIDRHFDGIRRRQEIRFRLNLSRRCLLSSRCLGSLAPNRTERPSSRRGSSRGFLHGRRRFVFARRSWLGRGRRLALAARSIAASALVTAAFGVLVG